MFYTCFLSRTDQKCAELSTFWQFFCHRPPGKFWYTAGEIVKTWCQELDIYLYIEIFCSSSTWDYTTFQFFCFFFNVKKKSFSKLGRSVIGWRSGLIMLGFMDLRWPRVARRSNVGLVIHVFVVHYIVVYSYIWVKPNHKRSVLSSTDLKLNLHQAVNTSTQNWGGCLLQCDEYLLEQDCISGALWFQCNSINLGLDMKYNLGFCRFDLLRSILMHHFNVNFWDFDTSRLILIAYDILSYFMWSIEQNGNWTKFCQFYPLLTYWGLVAQ